MQCDKCGQVLSKEDRFCVSCGNVVKSRTVLSNKFYKWMVVGVLLIIAISALFINEKKPSDEEIYVDLETELNKNYNIYFYDSNGVLEIVEAVAEDETSNENDKDTYYKKWNITIANEICQREIELNTVYKKDKDWYFDRVEMIDLSKKSKPIKGVAIEDIEKKYVSTYETVTVVDEMLDYENGKQSFLIEVKLSTELVDIDGIIETEYYWNNDQQTWILLKEDTNKLNKTWKLDGIWGTSYVAQFNYQTDLIFDIKEISKNNYTLGYTRTRKDLAFQSIKPKTQYYDDVAIKYDVENECLKWSVSEYSTKTQYIYFTPYEIWYEEHFENGERGEKHFLERQDESVESLYAEDNSLNHDMCYKYTYLPVQSIGAEELTLCIERINKRAEAAGLKMEAVNEEGRLAVYLNPTYEDNSIVYAQDITCQGIVKLYCGQYKITNDMIKNCYIKEIHNLSGMVEIEICLNEEGRSVLNSIKNQQPEDYLYFDVDDRGWDKQMVMYMSGEDKIVIEIVGNEQMAKIVCAYMTEEPLLCSFTRMGEREPITIQTIN